MLTLASNTILEPVCAEMLREMPQMTAHFARFHVTPIALDATSLDQFEPAPMRAAADLLADAHVRAICWNGTSASWMGPETDHRLRAVVKAATGIPATEPPRVSRRRFCWSQATSLG